MHSLHYSAPWARHQPISLPACKDPASPRMKQRHIAIWCPSCLCLYTQRSSIWWPTAFSAVIRCVGRKTTPDSCHLRERDREYWYGMVSQIRRWFVFSTVTSETPSDDTLRRGYRWQVEAVMQNCWKLKLIAYTSESWMRYIQFRKKIMSWPVCFYFQYKWSLSVWIACSMLLTSSHCSS